MSDLKETVGFLERVPLLNGLKPRQLELIARRCVERQFPAGQPIVTQGQGGEGFFVIVAGRAEAIRERGDGARVVVSSFGPTDYFGELTLLDDGLRTASVVTTEPTVCLVLARWDFLGALREDPEMSITLLQELARRFRRALEAL